MTRPKFVYHAARRGDRHPPSSLSGLADCLTAGASIIEVDIAPLADGGFALVHDARLEHVSEGRGLVPAATSDQIRGLHHRWHQRIDEPLIDPPLIDPPLTDEPLGLLSDAVALIEKHPGLAELQLDLKPYRPLTDDVLRSLLHHVAPVKAKVRVSCTADWAIRRLAALDDALPLGFDPLLYMDVERGDASKEAAPPLRTGAYGYLDEHPLALARWGAPGDYLAARAEALWTQAPVAVWYIRGALLARALDDGFDWIAWLHDQGALVVAWTLDASHAHQLDLARTLAKAGVDRITTNDADALAKALS
jgi:glycerophosphoryl diester phosphodiesterase